MPLRWYPAIVETDDQPGFDVHFPDFPGCHSAGATIEEAARNAEVALRGHLRLMVEDGDPIPDPTPFDQVEVDPEIQEACRLLVRAEFPGRATRLNISMDEGLVSQVDAAAKSRGMNRSAFLAEAARRLIETE